MIRKSLTRKIILVFSVILISVISLNIVINAFLLPKVHRERKIDAMQEVYDSLSEQYLNGADDSIIVETVKETLSKENLRVFVWDSEGELIIDSLPLSRERENFNRPSAQVREEFDVPPGELATEWQVHFNDFDNDRFRRDGFKHRDNELFLLNVKIDESDIISVTGDYEVFSLTTPDNQREEQLCLRGDLPHEYKILVQMPVASISEAVYISNILMLISGAVMLLLGVFVVAITARTIAKPVKELSGIANSMQKLDFSQKYTHNRKDEIGSLGDSINSLSEKLEYTINELHKKNTALEKDIEAKSRLDTMRKEFVANASHELKTPVALIQGYAEGLRDNVRTDDESRKLYTSVIIEETERVDYIIKQLLDLMEMDSAEEILEGEQFSLTELVGTVVENFSVVMKNKSIKLDLDLDECLVYGDYRKIYQAVTNYISNAVNHVDEKRKISVSVKNNGDKSSFMVYNTGAGIPEGDIDRIWERFYKVDKAHTREYGGTGLGLSIVRSVIELHGGQYGFINRPEGVEFYFMLNKEKNNAN